VQRKALRKPGGLPRDSPAEWGASTRQLAPAGHWPGTRHPQKSERQPLIVRTRITRLVRKTLCCSKTTQMQDIVIGLLVNRSACGRTV
jgi:insertion element IS1 protein InsB